MRLKASGPGLFLILFQPKRQKQRIINPPGHSHAVIALIMGNRIASTGAGISIDWTTIVSLIGQPHLNIAHRRASVRITGIRVIRRVSPVDNQPAAVIPAVIVMVPVMLIIPVPIVVCISVKPEATVMVASGVLLLGGIDLSPLLGGVNLGLTPLFVSGSINRFRTP